jgi:hypothetical protein
MTRDAPDFTAAVRLVNGSGLDPMARAVLLAVLCEGIDIGAGRWAWVGTVAALAAASGVGLSAVKVRLGQLAEAGAMGSDQVAGMVAKTFDFATIGRVATAHGRVATVGGRLATVDGRVAAESGASESIGRVATVDGRVATTAPDGTGLAIRAQAPARDSLLGSFQEPVLARARAELLDGLVREPAREAPPSPPEPMGAQLTPELRAAMGTLDRACGWAFTPAVWVDGIMAAVRAHGPEATTSAIMALAEWATGTSGHRRIPRVTWLAERAAQAAQPKAQGRPGANPNLREMSTCPKFWAEQAAALSARLPAYTMPTPEELEQMPW